MLLLDGRPWGWKHKKPVIVTISSMKHSETGLLSYWKKKQKRRNKKGGKLEMYGNVLIISWILETSLLEEISKHHRETIIFGLQACLHIVSSRSHVAFLIAASRMTVPFKSLSFPNTRSWLVFTLLLHKPGQYWMRNMINKKRSRMVKVWTHYMRWNVGKWIKFRSLMNLRSIQAENCSKSNYCNQAHVLYLQLGINTHLEEASSAKREKSPPIPIFQVHDSSCGPAIWVMDPFLPSLARQHKSCASLKQSVHPWC